MFKFLCCAFFLITILNTDSSYASENKVVKQVFNDRGYVPKAGYLPTKEAAIAVAEIILAEIYGIEAVRKQKRFLDRVIPSDPCEWGCRAAVMVTCVAATTSCTVISGGAGLPTVPGVGFACSTSLGIPCREGCAPRPICEK